MSDYAKRFFWDPETIGIREMQDRAFTAKDASVLQEFHDSYCTEDGRRVDFVPRRKNLPMKQSHYSWEANSYTWQLIASRCRLKVHVLRTHARLNNKGAGWHVRKLILSASTRHEETEDKCHAMENSFRFISAWASFLILELCIGKWTELTTWNTCNVLRFRIYRTANVRKSIQIFLQQSLHNNGRN